MYVNNEAENREPQLQNKRGDPKNLIMHVFWRYLKMKKRLAISIIVALTMFFMMSLQAFAASAPVPGDPAWNANYAKAAFKTNAPVLWDRGNASGEKITSNAHSADYPGVYFYWDDKQKDNGVLLVSEYVFDFFQDDYTYSLANVDKKKAPNGITFAAGDPGFVLTAKNSNNYWGFKIAKSTGVVVGKDKQGFDIYAYSVPKQIQFINDKGKNDKEDLKNINMVFIDGLYKDGHFLIAKNWYNEDGSRIVFPNAMAMVEQNKLVSFNNGYKIGQNSVSITTYKEAAFGKKISVTEKIPAGWFEKDGKGTQSVTAKQFAEFDRVTFNNQKLYANIIIEKVWLDEDGNVIEDAAGLEAAFEINGDAAALGLNKVKEGDFAVAETDCTAGFTLQAITVEGDASDVDIDVVEGEASFGVIAGKTVTVTFYNQADKITVKHGVDVEKWVDGQFILDWESDFDIWDLMDMMEFEIYSTDSKDGAFDEDNPLGRGYLTADGIISFGTLEVDEGWYVIKEFLINGGEEFFVEADPLYIYVGKFGVYVGESFAWVSGEHFGTKVVHDGTGVNYVLPDVWDGVLSGQPAYEALKKMGAFWVWDIEDTYAYGVTGSVYTETFEFTAIEAGTVKGYLAADNAAVVYVNGKLAGYTTVAFNTPGNTPADDLAAFNYGALDASVFDGGWAEGWNYSYDFDINYVEGVNTVTIIAANSARTSGTGTANDGYDTTNNPCGVLFGFITPPEAVFNNYTIIPPKFGIELEKYVDGQLIAYWADDEGYDIGDMIDMMEFELFKLVDGDWVPMGPGSLSNEGLITFGILADFDPGDYMLVETLVGLGPSFFEDPEPYYFTITEEDFEGVFDNYTHTPPPEIGVLDKIPSKQHVDRWWDKYGILAYGASSNTDKFDYFFGFAEDFWDNNESVTIGFGTKGSLQEYVITYDAGQLICDAIDFRDYVSGSINFDQHYTGKEKLHPFPISVGAYFDNPGASGKQQLWLISIQPKAVKSEASVEISAAMFELDLGDLGPFEPSATGDEDNSVAGPEDAQATEPEPAIEPEPVIEPEPAPEPEPDPDPAGE